MAENPDPHRVPQQNRRNKVRVTTDKANQERPSSYIFQTNLPSLFQLNPLTTWPSSSSSSSLQNLYPSSFQDQKDHINYQQPFYNHQGLSLSLPFHHFPLNLNAQQYDTVSVSGDSLKEKGEVRNSVPLGPFTGYASILMRSRFVRPAQQILDEFCGAVYFDASRSQVESFGETSVKDFLSLSDRIERSWKNSSLVLMLEEVYRKYKLYCQQMQSVVASFETVTGLGHAAPYTSFAFKTISKHFCCLKNAILDQIHDSRKTVSDNIVGRDTAEQGSYCQKPVQNSGFLRPPHWRSQRALPDHAVAVLKRWLYENFLHPYPTDSDKQMLAQRTGLSKNQVSNWFINARVRLWRPMVEEIHMLEIGHTQTPPVAMYPGIKMPSHQNIISAEKLPQTTQSQQAELVPTKRRRNKRAQMSKQNEEQKNAALSNLSSDLHIGLGGSSDISLALALHQNNENELSRPFPVSVPRHFDLEMEAEVDVETVQSSSGKLVYQPSG